MEALQEFVKIAPNLKYPLVLVGFGLLLFFGVCYTLIRGEAATTTKRRTGRRSQSDAMRPAFSIAVLLITLGFGLEFYDHYHGYQIEKLRIIVQYQSEQVRIASDDQRLYGVTKPLDSILVKIRKGTPTPDTVRPGETVKITMDYSLILPQNLQTAFVTESWTLKKDNKVLTEFTGQKNQRTPGGYAVQATIPVPRKAESGIYVLEYKVLAGSSYDTDESIFVVKR